MPISEQYDHEVVIDGNRSLHHVEIPLAKRDALHHYSVKTGDQTSTDATFKSCPSEVLRVAVAADWQRKPVSSGVTGGRFRGSRGPEEWSVDRGEWLLDLGAGTENGWRCRSEGINLDGR